MQHVIKEIADNLLAIALWDSSWNSYNNCYLIVRGNGFTLIDCCKSAQEDALLSALSEIDVDPSDVQKLVATHGHQDHVGTSDLFTHAEKWIHIGDKDLLSEEQCREFRFLDQAYGTVCGLAFASLGHHTSGSIALYDSATQCLFCGDHIGFFGDELPAEGVLTFGKDLRAKTIDFVTNWAASPEDRSKYRFDAFVDGLRVLRSFSGPNLLATGHGPVLRDQIPEFLDSVLAVTRNR